MPLLRFRNIHWTIDGNHLIPPQKQQREQSALPPATEVELALLVPHLERPKHTKLHATRTPALFESPYKHGDLPPSGRAALAVRPAWAASLDRRRVAPLVACRREDIDHDGAVRAHLHVVRNIARNRPDIPGSELARFLSNPEAERPAQAHPELLVFVAVLGNDAAGVELHHAERGPVAVDEASVDTLPDPLQLERRNTAEGAHPADDRDMPFLPSVRFGVDTQAAPDEVRERLLGATGARRTTGHPFTGTVDTSTFELRPVLGYGNSFAPIAHGSFATGITGTRVEVVMRPLPSVSVFMAVWLAGVAAFLVVGLVVAVRDPSRSWFALVALLFLAFGYGLMMLGFSFEARRMRGNLERLVVSGGSTSQSTGVDLSWLSDFRLKNAERPERLFNRIFLTAYAASGILAVFA